MHDSDEKRARGDSEHVSVFVRMRAVPPGSVDMEVHVHAPLMGVSVPMNLPSAQSRLNGARAEKNQHDGDRRLHRPRDRRWNRQLQADDSDTCCEQRRGVTHAPGGPNQ